MDVYLQIIGQSNKIIIIIIKLLLNYVMGWEESRVYLLEDDKEDTTLNY
jgi:hypothetical protein